MCLLPTTGLDTLIEVAETDSHEALAKGHREWVEEAPLDNRLQKDEAWTRSLVVGSERFVRKVQATSGVRGIGRAVIVASDTNVLREEPEYGAGFDPENRAIASNTDHFRRVFC